MAYFSRLKKKWEIRSNYHFWLIMSIFAVTGTSILFTKPILFGMLGIDSSMNTIIYILLYILIITPVYFTTLLLIGSLLGQYRFFNKFILKTLRIR